MLLKTLLTSVAVIAMVIIAITATETSSSSAAVTKSAVTVTTIPACGRVTEPAAPVAMVWPYSCFKEPAEPLASRLTPRCTTEMVIVHHSDSANDTLESIRHEHIDVRKWDDVGYHFVIERDGTIRTGRDMRAVGAHANMAGVNRNLSSIGICVVGKDDFTDSQLVSLKKLLAELSDYYKIQLAADTASPYYSGTLRCHHENCPGPTLSAWLAENY